MQIVYDILIFGFLVTVGAFLARVTRAWIIERDLSTDRQGRGAGRMRPLPLAALIILALGWLAVLYGSFIEPRLLVVNEQTVSLNVIASAAKQSQAELKIAFISDLHVGPYKKRAFVLRVVEKINSLKPDIVIIGGDNVYDAANQIKYLEPLKNLAAPRGVYAVMGNHDYGEENYLIGKWEDSERAAPMINALKSIGIKVLINQGERVRVNGKTLYLFGLDDIYTDRGSISAALKSLGLAKMPHPNIVAAHNPDFFNAASRAQVDLLLAAHTHAGQIRLPVYGPVPEIPTRLGREYDRGFFRLRDTLMYITSGVGESGPRARLFAPPEITMLNVKF